MSQKLALLFILLISILSHTINAQQAGVDQAEQYVFKQRPQQKQSNYGLISPFTYEWTQLLEQYHNTFGNKNVTNDDSTCLHPIPKFHCKPFFWHDAIVDRDAYHLRPSVSLLGSSL